MVSFRMLWINFHPLLLLTQYSQLTIMALPKTMASLLVQLTGEYAIGYRKTFNTVYSFWKRKAIIIHQTKKCENYFFFNFTINFLYATYTKFIYDMQCNVVQIISYLLNKFSEVLLQPRLRDSFYWEHFLTFVFWYTALNLFL